MLSPTLTITLCPVYPSIVASLKTVVSSTPPWAQHHYYAPPSIACLLFSLLSPSLRTTRLTPAPSIAGLPSLVRQQLYDIVVGDMQPAVMAKIDQLNNKEVELSRLNEAFCTSMAMYEQLQRDGELALSGQVSVCVCAGCRCSALPVQASPFFPVASSLFLVLSPMPHVLSSLSYCCCV